MKDNKYAGFCKGFVNDHRIENRVEKVMSDMFLFGKAIVNKFSSTHTEKIGAYRVLNNQKFNHMDLMKGLVKSCKENQGAKHLLCIQDTTEFNYSSHIERIGKDDMDIGPVSKNSNAGFFCHPVLAVEADTNIPIGIPYAKIWNRSWDKKDKNEREYQNLDIKDKESYRWIDSALSCKEVLSETPMITIIGDRESDIYEELTDVPSDNVFLLIRSSQNRKLHGSSLKLFETLESEEERLRLNLEIKGNKKRKNRTANMALKYAKVKVLKPANIRNKQTKDYVECWAIEIRELGSSVPEGEEPVLWRLLTTHDISSPQDALLYANWYSKRWLIEEFFRVLKSKGLNVEASQLETGSALKKLVVMAMQVAITTMALKLSISNEQQGEAKYYFSNQELIFLKIMLLQTQGRTVKQQNPYRENSLAWACWIIARLSGWSGYISQGPPGYISIKNGLDIFNQNFTGYIIAKTMLQKDVYKE